MFRFQILAFAALLLLPNLGYSGDVTYRATMTGIDCAACKKTIARALGSIDGVKTIRIAPASKDKHALTIIADDSTRISKSTAVKALGKKSHYVIVSWSRS